jgi:hypothetical protein
MTTELVVLRPRRLSLWWVAAAWIGWPMLLAALAVGAFWLWAVFLVPSVNTFEVHRSSSAALHPVSRAESASQLLVLAVMLAILVGPPLALTAAWRKGRGSDRDQPT